MASPPSNPTLISLSCTSVFGELILLSIGLSMMRQSPNLPYAHELTKLSDAVAFKVGSSVAQEPSWCSKD